MHNCTKVLLALSLLLIIIVSEAYSQCDATVPTFTVDLSNSKTYTWISPDTVRVGNCCGTSSPDRCIKFVVTLPSNASGILFDIYSGAKPTGSMFYQVSCSSPTPVGDSLCLNGGGPHIITFCKPGSNVNQYVITSFPNTGVSSDIVVNDGCQGIMYAYGYQLNTLKWNSVYPDTVGAYNHYLSCAIGCDSTVVTGQVGYPAYVDYQICGMPSGGCDSMERCDTIRVFFNSTLGVNIQPEEPTICYGATHTTISAHGTGGSPPYSYYWSTGDSTQYIDVDTGTYIVTVFDTSNCPPNYDTVTVTAFSSTIAADAGQDLLSCDSFVNLSGQVIAASGGTWIGGNGSFTPSRDSLISTYFPTATELSTGMVSFILVTTGNGSCPADSDTVIVTFRKFTDTITGVETNISCFGANDGKVQLNILGTTSPYLFNWSNTDTTQIITDLTPGTYSVIVTDSGGCTFLDTFLITEPPPLSITHDSTNVSCFGGNNGTANIYVSGGSPGYFVDWQHSSSSYNLSNLYAGTYVVTVSDTNNCSIMDSVYISEPPALVIAPSITEVVCFGESNGSIITNPTGGISPYSYSWSNSATTADVSGLTAGAYYFQLTDSNNCVLNDTFTITQPTILTHSGTIQQISCFEANDASIQLSVSGSMPPYSYSWSNSATTQNLSSLAIGIYYVQITDSVGCINTDSFTITQPTPLQVSHDSSLVSCFGGSDGSIDLYVSGGTPGYFINWQHSSSSYNLSNLYAGKYVVTVTDTNACSVQDSVIISEPNALAIAPNITDVVCFGESNGGIITNPSGGINPYSFSWSNSATTEDISGLSAGIYYFQLTDSNNCELRDTFTIYQPVPLVLSGVITDVSCHGSANGSVIISVSGSVPPYSYSWSNGKNTKNNTAISGATYFLTVTDSNACTINDSFLVSEPDALTLTFNENNVSCFGNADGQLSVIVQGGIAPYQYSWSNSDTNSTISQLDPGIYTLIVADQNNCLLLDTFEIIEPSPLFVMHNIIDAKCFGSNTGHLHVQAYGGTTPYTYNWQNGPTNAKLDSIVAGKYLLTVYDSNLCSLTDSFMVNQPDSLELSAIVKHVCYNTNNGSIDIEIKGGITPYTYLWSTNETSQDINNLVKGAYTVTVTDANMCILRNTFNVLESSVPMQISFDQLNVSCHGFNNGEAEAVINGGTSPFLYSWSTFEYTKEIVNLSPGTYQLIVIDSLGCIDSSNLTITEPQPLNIVFTITDVSCFNYNDGIITSVVTGGTQPYGFLWDIGISKQNLSKLGQGTYKLSVLDSNNCLVSKSIQIKEPPELLYSKEIQDLSCYGSNDGKIIIDITAGSPPFNCSWSTGDTTQNLTNIPAGKYYLTINEQNNCITNDSLLVKQPLELAMSYQKLDESCEGDKDGSIEINIAGGTKPYAYLWSAGETTEDLSNLAAGQYLVIVTDSQGCKITSPLITLLTNPLPEPNLYPSSNTSICKDDTIEIWVLESYIDYLWNNGQRSKSIIVSEQGIYNAIVTDANGCKGKTDDVMISRIDPALYLTLEDEYVFCPEDGPISIWASTHSEGSFYWDPGGDTTAAIWVYSEGTFVVTYEISGCEVKDSTHVSEVCPPIIHLPNVITPNGDGLNDVFEVFTMYVDELHYFVFDRWGEILYRGESIDDKWDGTFKGETVQMEVYGYILWYSSKEYGQFKKTGKITVLK